MKGLGRPVSSLIKGRTFAAQAAAAQTQQVALGKQDVKISKLPSGAIIASLENNSPVSRVGVLFNAGSRYEDGQNSGVTHALRNACQLSGQHATAFSITRNIQQTGANVSCSTTRDHMMYSLECIRSGLDHSLKYFTDAVCAPAFKPHEVPTLVSKHSLDLGVLEQSPQVQLVEALHQAAYRDGLKNSLYMPAYSVGSHDGEMMSQFISRHYTTGNMAVVGLGVEHDQLVEHIKGLELGQGAGAAPKASYHGGEIRISGSGPLVYAALVTEGASLGSSDLLPVAVLQHVMGTGPYSKYSSNVTSSRVAKAVAGATQAPFAATCINSSYTDSGLFGFQVVAQSSDMTQVLQSLVKTFADATKGITDAEVQRAKSQLKSALLMSQESGSGLFDDMCVQTLTSGQVISIDQMITAVDAVTTAQVQSAAKKVINAKPAMAAIGNLEKTPYLDQLL